MSEKSEIVVTGFSTKENASVQMRGIVTASVTLNTYAHIQFDDAKTELLRVAGR